MNDDGRHLFTREYDSSPTQLHWSEKSLARSLEHLAHRARDEQLIYSPFAGERGGGGDGQNRGRAGDACSNGSGDR